MKNKTKYTIILILMLLATVASLVLTFVPLEKACGNSQSCTVVQTSQYESTLGIKNAHLGLIAFPILAILTLFEIKKTNKYRKRLLGLGIILGSMFAVYFLYIQLFILKAVCKYCLVVDIGTLISLGLIFIEEKELK
jgi:uncharacterized membrane protein